MISVDRYFAITKPLKYGVKRTPKRMLIYIAVVWLSAAAISIPPPVILGNEHGTDTFRECVVCQNFWYQILATLGSFYIPLIVMMVVYSRIFKAAKRITNEEKKSQIYMSQRQSLVAGNCEAVSASRNNHHSKIAAAAAIVTTERSAARNGSANARGSIYKANNSVPLPCSRSAPSMSPTAHVTTRVMSMSLSDSEEENSRRSEMFDLFLFLNALHYPCLQMDYVHEDEITSSSL
jgi:hypothetical protein